MLSFFILATRFPPTHLKDLEQLNPKTFVCVKPT